MKSITRVGLLIAALLPGAAVAAEPVRLTDAELAEGWISLFDGQTLFGWQPAGKANWRVADGVITVDEGEPCLLCTTSQFGDYVLQLDFRAPKTTNSGVFLHTPLRPTDPQKDCYELNIAGEGVSPFTTGGFVGRQKTEKLHASEDWQTFQVTLQGGHAQIKIGDEVVLEYDDPKSLKRGFIGLQHNKGKVEFRNIKLKPLGLKPLFNGKDLTGWREDFQGESKFTVTDAGELNARGGKGQLESKEKFGDFVLQAESITHEANLNGGIFFRCIPGESMNGYESQIHNGFQGNDRTKPKDAGTGAIFRRQNARRVVPNDKEWFFKTIVADGPHLAVWVNGYQVTDWTDTREPNPNPRNGLRTEAGTIQLQGHDPTTSLSFRNLRAVETPRRP